MSISRITNKQLVGMIKAVGEAIINRAEDIVGTSEEIACIDIDICLNTDMDSLPELSINRSIVPKELFHYVSSEKWIIDGRKEKQDDQA